LGYLLKDFITSLDEDFVNEILTNLIKEKNEFSRIPIFDSIVALQSHKSLSKLQDFICTVITNLSSDECWRVRYTVAEKIHEILKFSGISSQVKSLCVDVFAKYLDDPEAEVRKAVCLTLDKFFENLGKDDQSDKILKQFKKIDKDPQLFVKSMCV